jgi:hypothetical protein
MLSDILFGGVKHSRNGLAVGSGYGDGISRGGIGHSHGESFVEIRVGESLLDMHQYGERRFLCGG